MSRYWISELYNWTEVFPNQDQDKWWEKQNDMKEKSRNLNSQLKGEGTTSREKLNELPKESSDQIEKF